MIVKMWRSNIYCMSVTGWSFLNSQSHYLAIVDVHWVGWWSEFRVFELFLKKYVQSLILTFRFFFFFFLSFSGWLRCWYLCYVVVLLCYCYCYCYCLKNE